MQIRNSESAAYRRMQPARECWFAGVSAWEFRICRVSGDCQAPFGRCSEWGGSEFGWRLRQCHMFRVPLCHDPARDSHGEVAARQIVAEAVPCRHAPGRGIRHASPHACHNLSAQPRPRPPLHSPQPTTQRRTCPCAQRRSPPSRAPLGPPWRSHHVTPSPSKPRPTRTPLEVTPRHTLALQAARHPSAATAAAGSLPAPPAASSAGPGSPEPASGPLGAAPLGAAVAAAGAAAHSGLCSFQWPRWQAAEQYLACSGRKHHGAHVNAASIRFCTEVTGPRRHRPLAQPTLPPRHHSRAPGSTAVLMGSSSPPMKERPTPVAMCVYVYTYIFVHIPHVCMGSSSPAMPSSLAVR
jgi:hypothetical protein